MRLYLIALLSVALFASASMAADEPKAAQPPAVIAAMRERDKEVKEADEEYHQALIKAERALIAKLKVALVASTKAGNLPEANAIDGQIKSATARLDELNGKSPLYAIKAEKTWQQVTTLAAGDYVITAQGKWKWNPSAIGECGPNGSNKSSLGGRNVGALLVMVGDKQGLAGERATIHVESDGTPISFQMNDQTFEDNQGSLTVTITKVAH